MIRYITLLFILFSIVASAEVISSLQIIGNVSVESAVIRSNLGFKSGDEVGNAKLEQAVVNLYSTGLFADISMRIDQSKLIVQVKENPIINQLSIEGNSAVDKKEINKLITLKAYTLFSEDKLQQDILKLIKLYKENGITDVTIQPYKVDLKDNKIDVIYKIKEGEKAKIRKINFINNVSFSDYVLRSRLLSKEYKFYNFFASSHYYISDRVSLDGSLLRNFYLSKGFLDFKIRSIVPEYGEDGVYLTFIVDEGEKYTIESIGVISSIAGINTDSIKNVITINANDSFDINQINQSITNITSLLYDGGYYMVKVEPQYTSNGNVVVVNFNITEGEKIYVNQVNILGNDHTLDYVIRRELKIADGDPYNLIQINRSKHSVTNLGFFDSVDFITKPSAVSGKVDLDLLLKERNTGFVNIGGGFSSDSGAVGNITIRESNLLGSGNQLMLSLEKASSSLNTSISLTKSYTLFSPISSGFDVFRRISNHKHGNAFNNETYGITMRASYHISDDLSQLLKYSYTMNNIYDVAQNASPLIKEQAGITHTSLLGYALVYDKLDNSVMPKNGYLLKGGQDLAGIGGDLYYLRSDFSAVRFMTIMNNEDVVFQSFVKLSCINGYNGQGVKIGQRLFMGSNEVRGFKPSGVGPRDSITKDSLGGKFRVSGTIQADFPIGLPDDLGIKGSVFFDAGTLTKLDKVTSTVIDSGNVRASVGFGFSWISPLGPLRLDFGFPVLKDSSDITEIPRFNVGTTF